MKRKGPGPIDTLASLREHLQIAIQLEHATIPPYFTAWLSIKEGTNLDASEVIRSVLVEEMLHLTLAANVLNAVGGKPKLTKRGFVPHYPHRLPHSGDTFSVSIERFSKSALETFLRIERPQARGAKPQPHEYSTIGQFYAAIDEGIDILCDTLGETRVFTGKAERQLTPEQYYGSGKLLVVTGRASAHRAIEEIVEQGEGAKETLFDEDREIQGRGHGRELAHYFRYKQLLLGRRYTQHDTPTSPPSGRKLKVDFSSVYPIVKDDAVANYRRGSEIRKAMEGFARGYADLLKTLEAAFNGQPARMTEAMARMFSLKNQGLALMRTPSPKHKGRTVGLDFEAATR